MEITLLLENPAKASPGDITPGTINKIIEKKIINEGRPNPLTSAMVIKTIKVACINFFKHEVDFLIY